jgi:glycosyltransferase involved in cell wall biosynthesis
VKVSVVIPTYNRFSYLLNAIDSVKNQTYDDIEIIVVNDRSSEDSYYKYDFAGVNILHLDKNAIERHGGPMPGCYPRNVGIKISTGHYVAFLDDDDMWLPTKIELQVQAMESYGCEMSCSDGYIGRGVYDANKEYPRYNAEHYWGGLRKIYRKKGKGHLFPITESCDGFPDVWNHEFIDTHNCCVCSSVVISREVIEKTGYFEIMPFAEDWEYWRRALQHTDCAYVKDPCFYYDSGHGDGKKY